MSETVNPEDARGESRRLGRKHRRRRWVLIFVGLSLLTVLGTAAYHWFKVERAERFAAAGDGLVAANKWNDAAVEYRVALQLNPSSYRGLTGAARLASQADRPEAFQLWQRVVTLPQCTLQDRQDYADLLIKTNRLNLAERAIDPLLKDNPDTKTLQLAARYSRKIGDNAKAVEFARVASKRA